MGALALLAAGALPRSGWLVAGPAIALSAGVAVTVDQNDLDGRIIAAVHLGHHHGGDGALLVLTALLLSRVRIAPGLLRVIFTTYLGTMLAYGGVNFAQDLWREQVVKRGWTDVDIPSALVPGARPIWLVIVVLAALATLLLLREDDSREALPARA